MTVLHIVGAVDGFTWDRIALWYASIRRHAPTARVHLVAYNLSPQTTLMCRASGITIHLGASPGGHVVIRRFHDWACLIPSLDGDAILTDVRDVIFQEDPQPKLTALLSKHPIVVQEEPQDFRRGHFWCLANLRQAFPEYCAQLLDHNVICAGVIAGRGLELARLCQTVYDLSIRRPTADHLDQAALNVALRLDLPVYQEFHRAPRFDALVLPASHPWCFHSALLLLHPTIYQRLNDGALPPAMRDGVCYTESGYGERFAILHLCVQRGPWVDAVNRLYLGEAAHTAVQPTDCYQKANYV